MGKVSQLGLENLDATKHGGSTSPLEPGSMPGLLPNKSEGFDPNKFRVRYLKIDLNELSDITELERIETKAIRNQGVYILSTKDFIFMDKIFVMIRYIEEIS